MSEYAQIAAAVLIGALVTIAVTLAFKVHDLQRKAAREQRIQDAIRATLDATGTFRLTRSSPPTGAAHTSTPQEGHLRLVPAKAAELPVRRIHPTRPLAPPVVHSRWRGPY